MNRPRTFASASAWLFAIALIVLGPATALADWSQSGNLVADRSSDELIGLGFGAAATAIAPDPTGGCYVAYLFGTNGDSVAVNRLDGETGARLWGANGVKVNQGGNAASAPSVVEDLEGGCWVVWLDSRTGNNLLYAQRYDRNGTRGGPDGGFLVAVNGTSLPFGQSIAPSPGGDLVVAFWRTASLGLFAMRIHMVFTGAAPTIELAESQMTSDTGSPSDAPIQLFADGTGGGVLAWASNRGTLPGGAGTVKIVANRFNSAGARQWGTEGSVVQAGTGASAIGHRAYWDGTNLMVCWRHGTATSVSGIHAQKMNGTGVAQWGSTTTGVTVLTQSTTAFDDSTNSQPQITTDGGTGVWIAWIDGRDWHRLAPNGFEHAQDLYTQRLNSAGAAQLAANGVVSDSLPGSIAELKVAPGTAGELLLAYRTFLFEAGTLGDIDLRRVNTSGNSAGSDILNKAGSPSVVDDKQANAVVSPDGFGGINVAWDDNRATPNQDVYAVHRTGTLAVTGPTLTLVSPNGGETLHGLEPFNVTWTSTLPPTANVKLEYKFVNSRTLITSSTPNDGSFPWTVPNSQSTAFTVVVSEAVDGMPRDSSNATFSICSPMDIPGNYGPITGPNDAVLADLNRDGILDLVAPGTAGVVVQMGTGAGGVGDGSFDVPVVSTLSGTTRGIAVADFNGDGNLDVAATVGSGVTILTGNGTGALAVGSSFTTGGTVRAVVAADFNEDGILDLAAANSSSNSVGVLIGHGANGVGNGTFAAVAAYAVGTGPSGLLVIDIDNDSILDLIVTNNGSSSIIVLHGDGNVGTGLGDGTFTVGSPIAVPAGPFGICSGDFDEDGFRDVAISTNTGVTVLIGQGTGLFDPPVSYALGTSANDVVAGDFNGDGRQDLLVACGASDRVYFVFGNGTGSTGDGTFTVGGFDGGGNNPVALVLGDILENNVIDGVIMNQSENDEYPFYGSCGTALSSTITVTTPNGGEFLQVGSGKTISWTKGAAIKSVDIDISRDNGVHWTTIATGITGTSFFWNVTPPQAFVSARIRVRDSNLQNRNDQSNQSFTISTTPLLVTAPNGGESFTAFDGIAVRWGSIAGIPNVKIDLRLNTTVMNLVASTPNDGVEAVFLPNVSATQAKIIVSDAADGTPADSSDTFFSICKRIGDLTTLATHTRPRSIALGDFNEDGILDLVTHSQSVDSVGVALGLGAGGVGNGSFAPVVYSGAVGIGRACVSSDFDDDGLVDLIANTNTGLVFVRGQGNGTFVPGSSITLTAGATDIAVADFNEDGIEDLVAAIFTLDHLDVMLGRGAGGIGNGTFTPPVSYATQDAPAELVVADFNEDGIWDLAAINQNSSTVSVLLGQGTGGVGNGTFAAAVNYPAPTTPDRIIARDFGDDTILDLAIMGATELWTLPGNPGAAGVGNGTFGAHETSLLSDFPQDMAVMDVNFDEFADIALAASTPTRVDFLENDSGGAFGSVGSFFSTAAVFTNLVVADFNEDGAQDLAMCMTGDDQLGVSLASLCGASPGLVSLTSPEPQPGPNAVATRGGAASASAVNVTWMVGTNQTITWQKSTNVFGVDLAVSRDNGVNWQTIARGLTGNSFVWTVTPPQSASVRLRASNSETPGTSDVSVTPITITDPSVGVEPGVAPATAAFSSGRPNPARGDVQFEMALPKDSNVHVEVYDLGGRRVATLAQGHWASGVHLLKWSDSHVAGGVYFVRARWQGYDVTRRIVRMD